MIPLGVLASSYVAPAGGYTYTPIFTDDFNRADGELGSNWTNRIYSSVILSNEVKHINQGAYCLSYTVATAPSADMYAEVDLTYLAQWEASVTVRNGGAPDTRSCYIFGYNGIDNCSLVKIVGSTRTTLATYSATLTAPARLRIEAQGSDIRGYVNGVLRASATDTSLTAGRRGGLRGLGQGRYDNFEFGSIT